MSQRVTFFISFIGHGSSSGPSWGSPAAIDEVYLRNPMEPLDILKQKDFPIAESPRRIIGAVKTKTQFNYFRLNEDANDTASTVATTSSVMSSKNDAVSSDRPEEQLLIDLSPDLPVVPATNPLKPQQVYIQPMEPLLALPDQNRLYANYPSSPPKIKTSVSKETELPESAHYYSEVPIEPTSPTFTPPASNSTSPGRPVVTEELKKKRDEAFDWLGQALGEISIKNTNKSNVGTQDRTPSILLPHDVKPKPQTHGFEDNFSVSLETNLPSSNLTTVTAATDIYRQLPQQLPSFHRQTSNQIDAIRQPLYPKPGIWTNETHRDPSSTSYPYALPTPSRMLPSVQTAHVRPFIMANPSAPSMEVVYGPSLLNQVSVSTPWATETEIRQAMVIHNGCVADAVRYLQVEKLYR